MKFNIHRDIPGFFEWVGAPPKFWENSKIGEEF